jgi:hypothetical protein
MLAAEMDDYLMDDLSAEEIRERDRKKAIIFEQED